MSIHYAGRRFSDEDLALMRQAAKEYAALGVTEIARTICEWLDWRRPNGRLKNHECRLLLERLRDDGFLTLPPVRPLGKRGPRVPPLTAISDPQPPIQSAVAGLEPLAVRLVRDSEGLLFRQVIQRYHCLGYRVHPGANLRYFVESGDGRILAVLQWSSPAWTMAPRDRWIDRLEPATACPQPSVHRQQQPVPHPSMGSGEGTGLGDPGTGGPSAPRRLVRSLRL